MKLYGYYRILNSNSKISDIKKIAPVDIQSFLVGNSIPKKLPIQINNYLLKLPKSYYKFTPVECWRINWIEKTVHGLLFFSTYLSNMSIVYRRDHQKYDFLADKFAKLQNCNGCGFSFASL